MNPDPAPEPEPTIEPETPSGPEPEPDPEPTPDATSPPGPISAQAAVRTQPEDSAPPSARAPVPDQAAAPTPTPATEPERARAPWQIVLGVAALWFYVVVGIGYAAYNAILVRISFDSAAGRHYGALSLFLAVPSVVLALVVGILAVKLWTGSESARRALLIGGTIVLGFAIVEAELGDGYLLAFSIVLVAPIYRLLPTAAARAWCDPASDSHSSRIAPGPAAPYAVVITLAALWIVAGILLYTSFFALTMLSADLSDYIDGASAATFPLLGVAFLSALHLVFAAALTGRSNFGRIGTITLMSLYAAALGAVAVLAIPTEGFETWATRLALALIPLAFTWALLTGPARTWCQRT
ncbi:hypothetical protein [Glycomyces paridis]|uniref:Uncharacterized protein n=1 Tax=Glycomyces paridis TaxID=2126555 RepID=A0A4V4HNV7_9ACTN|nr:hypothetical protein [Glycomyces paridis]THV27546.1 hypothetical protein E9998_14125 [Glycomyces paridis]